MLLSNGSRYLNFGLPSWRRARESIRRRSKSISLVAYFELIVGGESICPSA
jgi:hypothetical protein